MQGVTTAIVAFIFVCMAMPKIVKNRPQFYCAFVAVLLVILLDTLAHLFAATPGSSFSRFVYVATGLLQAAAIVFLMLSAGGLSASDLAGELANAYEVVRRGETEKEIIIPIQGQMPARPTPAPRPPAAEEHKTYTLDEAGNEIPTPKPPEEDKGIPLA